MSNPHDDEFPLGPIVTSATAATSTPFGPVGTAFESSDLSNTGTLEVQATTTEFTKEEGRFPFGIDAAQLATDLGTIMAGIGSRQMIPQEYVRSTKRVQDDFEFTTITLTFAERRA